MTARLHPAFKTEITILSVHEGKVNFEVSCRVCGGAEQTIREHPPNDLSPVYCAACGIWLGRVTGIQFSAACLAKKQGYTVDLSKWTPDA